VTGLEPLAEHAGDDLLDALAPVEGEDAVAVVVQVASGATPHVVGLADLGAEDRRQEPFLLVEVPAGVPLLLEDVLDDLGQLVPRQAPLVQPGGSEQQLVRG
jgi:hypothetical protein